MHETFNGPEELTKHNLPVVLTRYKGLMEAGLSAAIPGCSTQLYEALRYHLGWVDENGRPTIGTDGKGLRPALCLLACEATGGVVEEAVPVAVAVELVHNFSLIHDDIQDQDLQRHHRPTVWSLWGEPQAINTGNTLYAIAFKTLLNLTKHQIAPERILQASVGLSQSSLDMIRGQYMDIEFEGRLDVTIREYLEMISYKTGALITCAMELGALIGSGDPIMASIFAKSGCYIGHLFQIRDDILGILGDTTTTGKATGSDIQRKKKTFPVIHALQYATGAEAATLHRVYGKPTISQSDAKQVLSVVEVTGACKEAETLAESLSCQALDILRSVEIPSTYVRDFEELVRFLLYRER